MNLEWGWDEPQPHCVPKGDIRRSPRMSEGVRPVFTPWNLGDNEFSQGNLLLQPELFDVEMADVPYPLPHNHASSGRGIRFQFKARVVPEALSESLGVEPFDCSFE